MEYEEFADWYCSEEVRQHGELCGEEAAEMAWNHQQEIIDQLREELSKYAP